MKNKRILVVFTFIVISFFLLTLSVSAQSELFTDTDNNENLRLGNDYIVILINQDDNAKGRFAIETTGGAPLEPSDDNKPLVYGRPKPWTSYTSLKINNIDYIFGGETRRRAGASAQYGEVIEGPVIKDNQIYTSTLIDDIKVEQILSIVKSNTTGLFDTAQIKYRIINNSNQEKSVGLRIMLDTMLGQNDGAPFRLEDRAVTNDTLYLRGELPIFWQAFDSVSNPTVTSQGTFKGPGVTSPDRVFFADWGSLADGEWNFDFNPGEEFVRKGEYEIDSAIALMWETVLIEPNQEITYVTNYGLGGIKVVPGILTLGVTSPAEFTFDNNNTYFPVVAYIENTSEITAENVKVEIKLPEMFKTDSLVKEIGDLESKNTAQVSWQISPSGSEIPGNMTYQVAVTADNTDSNQVERDIRFVGPPMIKTDISLEEDLIKDKGKISPNPFDLNVKLTNIGGSTLYDAKAEIALPPGLTLSVKEVSKKYLGYIESGENINLNWSIKVLNVTGEMPYSIDITGLNNYKKSTKENLAIPELEPYIYLEQVDFSENYITYNIIGENLNSVNRFNLRLEYNPTDYKVNYIFPGDLFVRNEKIILWEDPVKSEGLIEFNEMLPDFANSGIISTVQFRKLSDGDLNFIVNDIEAYNEQNNQIQIMYEN